MKQAITTLILVIISSYTTSLYSQIDAASEISAISNSLINDNENEYIKSNTFEFSFRNDTLFVYNRKEWKSEFIEEFVSTIPIHNINSIKVGSSDVENSLTIMSDKNDSNFLTEIIHENKVIDDTHIYIHSKQDKEAYLRIKEIIESLSNPQPRKELCKLDSLEYDKGKYIIGIRNNNLTSKVLVNNTTDYKETIEQALKNELSEKAGEKKFSYMAILISIDKNDNIVEIVNDSYQILCHMTKEMALKDEKSIQELADKMHLINIEEDQLIKKTIRSLSWKSAKCNETEVNAMLSVELKLN